MLLRCTNNEMATLDELCDGINDCTSGQDEVGIICESKLYIAMQTRHPKRGSVLCICMLHALP